VLDWFTKEIVGFDISLRSRSEDWFKALDMGLNKKFKKGVRGEGLKLLLVIMVHNQLQGHL